MAINVDQLYQGLEDYREVLERSNETLAQEFKYLQQSWLALRQNYEGQGAEEFSHAWIGTSDWFEKYFNEVISMTQFLEDRAKHLKKL